MRIVIDKCAILIGIGPFVGSSVEQFGIAGVVAGARKDSGRNFGTSHSCATDGNEVGIRLSRNRGERVT